ncbi:MAG: phosphate ABC transporter substrate-binding protein PstS [Bdellovibrionales bacterium]
MSYASRIFLGLFSLVVLLGLACPVGAADIQGAGATFPYPIYAKWADSYKKKSGIGLNYQPIGSGGGIKQIKAKTVTFGASDMPLKPEELKESGLMQWPMVIGGVVPVVNIPGIQAGAMTLDGNALAQIYLGAILYWDDPALAKLNPDLKLPHLAIAPVYRSDGSGTTFLFTAYLKEVDDAFSDKIGSNSSVSWVTGMGAKGNVGVATMVGQTTGSIGYVEYAYAMESHLTYTKMVNKAGKAMAPGIGSFQAAAAHAEWSADDGFYSVLVNQSGDDSWPMTGASFILMNNKPEDKAATKAALDFFSWAFKHGADMAKTMAYVPIPEFVVQKIKASWKPLVEP